MRFQTSFHVGSTRGCRGNGKLIIEMKPTSLCYHKGQLCGSSPPQVSFLFCIQCWNVSVSILYFSSSIHTNSLKKKICCVPERCKVEPLLSENVIEIAPDYQREIRLCLAFQLISKLLDPPTQSQLINQYFK